MSTRIWTALVILAFVAVLGFGLEASLAPAQDKAQARPKWEYKIAKVAQTTVVTEVGGGIKKSTMHAGVITEAALTALGEQGWELIKITAGQPFVSSFRSVPASGGQPTFTDNFIAYSNTVYYFKRPK